MVDTVKIAAQPRERAGKGAARAVRRSGRVPGVVYGEKKAPALIDLDPRDLDREMKKPGFFTRLFEIDTGKGSERALARDLQLHPVTDRPEHVDFMRVGATTRIRVAVPVKFVGQERSPGLKRGGVLNIVRHDIEVYCKADTIPSIIEISLEGLDIGDSVHINAVKLPEGVKPTIARNFTVCSVAAPTTVTAEAAPAAAAAAAAPAEGAAAPAAGAAPAKGAAPAAAAKGAAPAAPAGGDKKGGAAKK
ncbi:MAG: 50S ribosomal protein L25/general stress protein Ctc [Alphaproteobacteria bacterium]|nr:50S ribosomal protein L25/general stress protein Ctc [Alphaproteobacteria bacterium]